jgi:hypothetical protein
MPVVHTVFDAHNTAFHWSWDFAVPAVCAVLCLIGLICSTGRATWPRWAHVQFGRAQRYGFSFNLLWSGLFLAVVAIAGVAYAGQWNRVLREADSPTRSTVAGCLSYFHRGTGRRGDDFDVVAVGDKQFTYTDQVDNDGHAFGLMEIDGGPIHRDSWVRITYVGNDILHLEVADHACPAAPGATGRKI